MDINIVDKGEIGNSKVDNIIKSDAFKISATIVIIALTALAYYLSRNLIKKISFPAKVLVVVPALGAGGAIYAIWVRADKVSNLANKCFSGAKIYNDDDSVFDDDNDEETDTDFEKRLTDLSLYYAIGSQEGKFDPVHLALQELESESPREEDIKKEYDRLKKIPTVQNVFNKITSGYMKPKHFVALGHAIELREKLKKDYYVIIHGQKPSYMILNLASKRLRQILNNLGDKGFADVPLADMPLRDPCFLKDIKSYQTPDWFRRACDASGYGYDKDGHPYNGTGSGSGDERYRDKIICGDAYFASTSGSESALDFFSRGANIAHLDVKKYLKQQIQDCDLYKKKTEGEGLGDTTVLLDNLTKLAGKVAGNIKIGDDGNLYMICIPKKKFKQCGFLSSAFGRTIPGLSCHKDKEREVLKKLQDDEKVGGYYHAVPQVRLLAHTLIPSYGVQVLQESTFEEEFIKKVDTAIKAVIYDFLAPDPDFKLEALIN